jgi:hypothetical protein
MAQKGCFANDGNDDDDEEEEEEEEGKYNNSVGENLSKKVS